MNRQTALRRARLAPQIRSPLTAVAEGDLGIADMRVYPLREPVSRRTYTVVRLRTKSGLVGYGECSRASADEVAAVRQILIGRAATAYEVLRRDLARWPGLSAAVNMALLDVVGKSVNAPLYQVLGGPTRNKVRVIRTLSGATDVELAESLKRQVASGSRAFSVPLPELRARNQGQRFAKDVAARLEALRSVSGDAELVLDGAGALTPGDAASVTAAIERLHPLWFDEPCPLLNLDAVRKISAENVTPLGFGRTIHQASRFQDLLREDAIDVLRPDISLNGITQIKRMAAIAETYYVAVAPYHDGGPIATAAALHLAASLPNFFIQQIPGATDGPDRMMRASFGGSIETVTNGFAELPTGPGLGIHVDEAVFEKFREASA